MRIGGSGADRDPADDTYRWWESSQPGRDDVPLPLDRGWRVAGAIIGAVVVFFLVTFVLAESDNEPTEYRKIVPTAIETDAFDEPIVTGVELGVDTSMPDEGRVRVSGDGLVRVDIDGDALCAPVSGSAGVWIGVRVCGQLDTLTITAADDDGDVTKAVARF